MLDLVTADTPTHKTEKREAYFKVNPRGYVPASEIDGALHTDVAALLQYLTDQAPQSNPLPEHHARRGALL